MIYDLSFFFTKKIKNFLKLFKACVILLNMTYLIIIMVILIIIKITILIIFRVYLLFYYAICQMYRKDYKAKIEKMIYVGFHPNWAQVELKNHRNRPKFFFSENTIKISLPANFSFLIQILDFRQPFLSFWPSLVNRLKIFLFLMPNAYFSVKNIFLAAACRKFPAEFDSRVWTPKSKPAVNCR